MTRPKLIRTAAIAAKVVCALSLASVALAAQAISSGERAGLIDFYNATQGSGWFTSTNWTTGGSFNMAGTECTWYGITCDAAQTTVIRIQLRANGLAGTLPALTAFPNLQVFDVAGGPTSTQSLALNGLQGAIANPSGLTNLQTFDVSFNQLTGALPTLTDLPNLQYFAANHNQLTGAIASLNGVPTLQYFSVANNQLSGSIPLLGALTALQRFNVGANQLTGTLPAAPASLVANGSGVCPNNALAQIPDPAWDKATGVTPWYGLECAASNTVPVLTSGWNASVAGEAVTFSANVLSLGLGSGYGPSGTVNFIDTSNGATLCANVQIRISFGFGGFPPAWAYCTAILPSAGTHSIVAVYSGDSSNYPSTSPALAQIVGAPSAFNADQFGITGSWSEPNTSGQGLIMGAYPDLLGTGHAAFYAGWFISDVSAGGGIRWYTLQGNVDGAAAQNTVTIYNAVGGNFNSATPQVAVQSVGTATLSFGDCTHATLRYTFSDGSGRDGILALQRLDTSTTCSSSGDNGQFGADSLLSGAWSNPTFSNQGFIFSVSPSQTTLFGAWYTYAINGQTIGGSASQRWYTLQTNSYVPGSRSAKGVPMYVNTIIVFDAATVIDTEQVGTADIVFTSCNAMTVQYTFTSGENAGLSGTIPLNTVGPPPKFCPY